jgi:LPS-assembly protein
VDGVYDLESSTVTRNTIGFAYGDECFIYAMTYTQTRSPADNETKQSIGFHVTLRTIGDFGSDTSRFDQQGG